MHFIEIFLARRITSVMGAEGANYINGPSPTRLDPLKADGSVGRLQSSVRDAWKMASGVSHVSYDEWREWKPRNHDYRAYR